MLLPLATSLASAFALNGRVWPEDRLPIEVHWTGVQQGFTHDELQATIEAAAAAWTEAGPCNFGFTVVEDPDAYGWYDDGGVAVLFDDPYDELTDGVLAVLYAGVRAGDLSARLVLNDGDLWVSDADIAAGSCVEQDSLQGTLTYHFGFVLGLDNPCRWDDCDNPAEREATMAGLTQGCDVSVSTLNTDDVAGLAALYGEVFSFSCTANPDDGLTVDCAIITPSDVDSLSPTWTFGDGASASGASASNTYATQGSYDIELCMLPAGCSDFRCQTYSFAASVPILSGKDSDSGSGSDCDGCATDSTGATGASAFVALFSILGWARCRHDREAGD